MKVLNVLRTFAANGVLGRLRTMRSQLGSDASLLAFHEGRTKALPAFYRDQYTHRLGRYAELLSEADSTPVMEAPMELLSAAPASAGPATKARLPVLATSPLVAGRASQ